VSEITSNCSGERDPDRIAAMSEHVVVYCTIGKLAEEEPLARALVEERLAACVNILPILASIYRWKDRIEREGELLLVIKTRREKIEALKSAIVGRHPYEVPEIIVLPIEAGHAPYLAWIDECTTGGKAKD
jgi:periplasmic divalent cation tolerance protein